MYSKIKEQASFSTLVTLAEAKAQCNILLSQTIDDTYIQSLVLSACDIAQTYTHRLLSEGSIALRVDCGGSEVRLPYGEPTLITEIIIDDVDITADTEKYSLDDITEKLTINVSYTKLKVTYDAGYDVLPAKVKQGILLMISTMYENRGDWISGMTIAKAPMTSLKLLDSVKYYAT